MEFKDGDFILGIWFAEKRKFGNFLMIAIRRGDKYLLEYRFRYYKDDKVFDSKDERSFYTAEMPITAQTPEEVTKSMHLMFDVVCIRYSDFREHVDVMGSFDDLMKKMAGCSWWNCTVLPIQNEN